MEQKTITDYLNDEYKLYSLYVIEERAIPSVIDGFKPTQRKIIHVANKIWKTGKEKTLKVFQLGGKVASDAYYHHGDASLNSSIIGLAQKFKNSIPLLIEKGQFGNLRAPEAGAPRYIETALSPNFRLLYKDFELLDPKFEEGFEIEPKYFLPIVPTVLLNGSSGIAVGFATNILNRHPVEVIDACRDYLNGNTVKDLKPWFNNYTGKIEKDPENNSRYIFNGSYEIVNTTTVRVTELPPGMTYDKYEVHLNKLENEKKITNYDNNCKDNIDYVIKFTRSELSKLQKSGRLVKLLKLQESKSDNLTTLDENKELKIFNDTSEIIKYFVDYRLIYYKKRKEYLIKNLEDKINKLSNRARFIKGVIEDTIKVRKVAKENIIKQLEKLKFDKIDDSYSYLLNMPIYSLTKEKYEELLNALKETKEELKEIKATDHTDMYKKDLTDLKREVNKMF
jgi:DNA topoisomerase-2